MQKYAWRGGLEVVPAGPHKPCNVGSNPTPAIHRDVAQVVARVVWDHEAAGSSPVIPIKNMMGRCSIERRTEFNVYSIIKTTSYNARDGTGQTNG